MKDKIITFIGEHAYGICGAAVGLSLTMIGHSMDKESKCIRMILSFHNESLGAICSELEKKGVL